MWSPGRFVRRSYPAADRNWYSDSGFIASARPGVKNRVRRYAAGRERRREPDAAGCAVLHRVPEQVGGARAAELGDERLPRDHAMGLERRPVHDLPRERPPGHPEGDVDRERGIVVGDRLAPGEEDRLHGVVKLRDARRGPSGDHGVDDAAVHEDPEETLVLLEDLAQLVDDSDHELVRGERAPRVGVLEPRAILCPRHVPVLDDVEEVVLALDARVDRPDRDPRALRHLREREPVEALLLEEGRRSLEHALERGPAALLLRRLDGDGEVRHGTEARRVVGGWPHFLK